MTTQPLIFGKPFIWLSRDEDDERKFIGIAENGGDPKYPVVITSMNGFTVESQWNLSEEDVDGLLAALWTFKRKKG